MKIIYKLLSIAMVFCLSGLIFSNEIKQEDIDAKKLVDKLVEYAESKITIIHCDYCGDYEYNQDDIYQRRKTLVLFRGLDNDDKVLARIICNECLFHAYVKGLDKFLGKPKHIKTRPEGWDNEK